MPLSVQDFRQKKFAPDPSGTKQASCKFAVFKHPETDGDFPLYVFDTQHTHATVVRQALRKLSSRAQELFVGAGRISVLTLPTQEPKLTVTWDSRSCAGEYGYDRPSDRGKAEEILEEVRTEVLKLVRQDFGLSPD